MNQNTPFARLSGRFAPESFSGEVFLCFSFSVLLALLAQVSLILPFSPVPVTGQTLGVLLAGFALGSRGGTMAVMIYLAEGAMGLPVFAGGTGGIGAFFGASGGYLIGFLPAAWLAGWFAEKGYTESWLSMIPAALFAHLPLYACGLAWLGLWLGSAGSGLDVMTLLYAGLLPFLPGDALKAAIVIALLPSLRFISPR